MPHNLNPQTIQSLPSGSQQYVSNHLTTDTAGNIIEIGVVRGDPEIDVHRGEIGVG